MVDNKPSAVASAVGGSGGKPGRCCASVAGPQADDTRALAIALGTTRSTINALRTPMNREKTARTTANALRTAHTTAKRAQGAACSHGPVRLSLRAGSVGRRLNKKCLQNGSQSRGYSAGLQNASQSRGYSACFTLKQRGRSGGFTLAEILVSVGVLVLLVLLFTQLLNSAATITILGLKRMDADAEARQVFDRMALDFAQMVKRTDVDYYVKKSNQQQGNDQIAFYSAAPGYYTASAATPIPTSTPTNATKSPVSLVAYRVNSNPASASYNKLERLGKGLVWNGVSTTNTPAVFLPLTISNTWCQATITGTPSPTCTGTPDPNYEVIGPHVIRFEYFYKVTNGFLTDCVPGPNCSVNGWRGVAAIVVDIAVIDPKSKVLLDTVDPTGAQLSRLNGADGSVPLLQDFTTDPRPGKFITLWQNKLNAINTLPRQVLSGIRVYERYFYLNQ